MLSALRRNKSLPLWLAMIALCIVVVTLATLMISSLLQSHRLTDSSSDASAPATPLASAASGAPAVRSDATAGAASAADLAAENVASGSATAPLPASSISQVAQSAQAEQALASASATTAAALAASDVAMAMAAASTSAVTVGVPDTADAASDAKLDGAHHTAHVTTRLARRKAVEEAARTSRSLRADIARYNAERAAGFDRNQKMVPLRAAQVPSIHSLWDDVPAPISNLYRN